MLDEKALRAVASRYFQCLDSEDWEGMREIWHEDGRLEAIGARPRENRDGVIQYFSKLFGPWPKHEDKPVRVVVSVPDRVVTAEVKFTGTTEHGKEVVFAGLDVFDIGKDGRILRLSNWYDIDLARKSIAPPEAG
jgi:ketosteroid isomerase-like protein